MPRPPKSAAALTTTRGEDLVRVDARLPVDAIDAVAREEDRPRSVELRRAVEAWLAAGGETAAPPPHAARVTVRLPRALVVEIDRRVGTAPGAREGALCGAIAMRIAGKSRRSRKSTATR